jgi:Fe-S oxidoreductase
MKSRFQSRILRNKEMNQDVYKLRREVINLIYEAKRLAGNLPRIEVRVTEDKGKTLGCAAMGGRVIWITESFVASRATVFHEILHAVKAQPHVVGCPLMASHINPNLERETCDRLFVGYMGR